MDNGNQATLRGRNLSELYKFTPDKIFKFLGDVSDNPGGFGLPTDDELKNLLNEVRKNLLSLCGPTEKTKDIGQNYADPKLKGGKAITPNQHIYRARTGEEDLNPRPDDWSRFRVCSWDRNGPHFWPAKNQPSVRVQLRYWSHYDLLGLFLSLMGPAQPAATKLDFFIPLTAVYGRWCYVIGGNVKRGPKGQKVTVGSGIGASPTITQCTWRESKGPAGGWEFCLGASLAGIEKSKQSGSWETRVKMERFNLLTNFNNVSTETWPDPKDPDKKVGWAFENSPERTEGGDSKSHFGNCGETYPFLQIFDTWSNNNRNNIGGVAICKDYLDEQDMYEELLVEKLTDPKWITFRGKRKLDIGSLWPPCLNCTHLLKVAGITDPVKFKPITDVLQEIPPDPEAIQGTN